MQGWYKVTLPAEETGTGGKAALLQKSFEVVFMAHKGPKDAALFTDHDARFYNHYYYFTPVAAEIAKTVVYQFRGVACPAPHLHDDMPLLVGHSDARESLLKAS
jgi:hypothetical protein